MVITKNDALRAENTRLLADDAHTYNNMRSVIQGRFIDQSGVESGEKALTVKRKLALKQSPYTRVNPL